MCLGRQESKAPKINREGLLSFIKEFDILKTNTQSVVSHGANQNFVGPPYTPLYTVPTIFSSLFITSPHLNQGGILTNIN